MFNRRLRTRIPVCKEILKPEIHDRETITKSVVSNKEKQEYYYNESAKERDFNKIKNAKELYVFFNGCWNTAINMGEADTPGI